MGGKGSYFLTGETSWDVGPWSGSLKGGYTSGKGAYRMPRRNSLMGSLSMTGGVPKVRNAKKGEATIVAHREYVGEITSGTFDSSGAATAFFLQEYRLNPSNPELFPWLSAFAGAFQEWELNGCLIQLRTESSDIAPAVTLGMYGLAAEYNVLQPPPNSKIEVENMENAGTSKISVDLIMPIECARSQTSVTHLYVGPIGGADTGDLRLYDLCKFYIFSQGVPVQHAKIAELWITYEVAFYKPTITPLLHSQDSYSWYARFYHCSDTAIMGDTFLVATTSTSLIIWDGTWFNLPQLDGQCYLIYANWFGSQDFAVQTYDGDTPTITVEGAVATAMMGDYYSYGTTEFAETSATPLPFSSMAQVSSSALCFVLKLEATDPIGDWKPRFNFTALTGTLPPLDPTQPVACNVCITLFNRNFFELISGDWFIQFPAAMTLRTKTIGGRKHPQLTLPQEEKDISYHQEWPCGERGGNSEYPAERAQRDEIRVARARALNMYEPADGALNTLANMGFLPGENNPKLPGSRPRSLPQGRDMGGVKDASLDRK